MVFTLFRRRKERNAIGETGKQPSTPPCISAAIIADRRHVTGVPYALPKDLDVLLGPEPQHT